MSAIRADTRIVRLPLRRRQIRAVHAAFAAALMLAPKAGAQLLFLDDLESDDLKCWAARPSAGCDGWTSIRDAGIALVADGQAHSGKRSIRLTFAKDEDYAGTTRVVSARHLFTRFYDYYDADFDFANGMKIHRLSAYDAARQLNDFDIILYSQAADGPNFCGTTDARYLNLAFNGGPVDWGLVGGTLQIQRKRWYCIETEVKLNTPGKSDGEMRIWVDGKLFAEKKGMNISGSSASPINRVLFGGWYSNGAAGKNPCPNPYKPSIRYVDDVAISTSYIGTIPAVALGPSKGTRVLTWVMPEGGTAKAEYGATTSYGLTTAPSVQPQGLFSLVLPGLDTNRVYHYRLRCTLNSGSEYISPDYAFTTAPGTSAGGPRKPGKPVNLPPNLYDPIPD